MPRPIPDHAEIFPWTRLEQQGMFSISKRRGRPCRHYDQPGYGVVLNTDEKVHVTAPKAMVTTTMQRPLQREKA